MHRESISEDLPMTGNLLGSGMFAGPSSPRLGVRTGCRCFQPLASENGSRMATSYNVCSGGTFYPVPLALAAPGTSGTQPQTCHLRCHVQAAPVPSRPQTLVPSKSNSRRLSQTRIMAIGSSTVAIDNKIEQAMDLVKSHLMFAVREEVEVLKEQIAELIERNNQLEYENGILRAAATPETLAKLVLPRQQPPSSSS